jgi:hypothetical protein
MKSCGINESESGIAIAKINGNQWARMRFMAALNGSGACRAASASRIKTTSPARVAASLAHQRASLRLFNVTHSAALWYAAVSAAPPLYARFHLCATRAAPRTGAILHANLAHSRSRRNRRAASRQRRAEIGKSNEENLEEKSKMAAWQNGEMA